MTSRTSQRRTIAAERRQKALEFRRAGLSFEGIAKQLGISRSQAHRLVTQAMEEIAKEVAQEAELVRAL
ncbi:MAG: helix-turn-helix domain-containing protein, partial [Halomonas sp.]